jgi:hypothetical protein
VSPALDAVAETPFRAGLAVGLALALAFVLLAGDLGALAAAPTLVGIGLVASYAVDTAVEWARWLSDDASTAPDRAPRDARERPRRTARADDEPAPGEVRDALDRLRERYAAGDLDDATFERKLETLLAPEAPEDARRHATRTERTRGTVAESTVGPEARRESESGSG